MKKRRSLSLWLMSNLRKIAIGIFLLLLVSSIGGYFFATYQVKGSYFESDGANIHYTDEGNGVPVVLVHGFAANSDLNWRRPGMHKRLLKEGFRVITVDLRGHGLSSKPHDTALYGTHLPMDVIELLEHLKIEKAHLVGYSLGGFVVLKCAVLAPDKWISVTSMASGWEDPEKSKSFEILQRAVRDFQSGKPIGPLINYFAESAETKTGFLHTQWFKILSTYLNDREALVAMIESGKELGVTGDELAAIKTRLCGIIGDKDPFLTKAQAISGKVPNHTLIVAEGADHITTMTSTKAKDGLVNFLKANSR